MKRLTYARTVSFCFVLILLCGAVNAQTTSGTLPGNETWSGVVTLTGDVTVPVGVTLQIQPGTTVIFPAGSDSTSGGTDTTKTELIVNGTLKALGVEGSEIVFTSSAASPAKGNWYGIRSINAVTPQPIELDYCVIEYAQTAITWTVSAGTHSISVTNTTISAMNANGIEMRGTSASQLIATIADSYITNVSGYGIYARVDNANTKITAQIARTTISYAGNNGIYVYINSSGAADFDLDNDTIHNTHKYGIFYEVNYGYAYKSSLSMKNLLVHSVTSSTSTDGDGIYCVVRYTGMDFSLTDSEIHTVARNGVRFYTHGNDSWYRENVKILRNTVHHAAADGILVEATTKNYVYVDIIDNEVYANGSEGIRCEQPSNYNTSPLYLAMTISLNRSYNNGSWGMFCKAIDEVAVITYNDIHSNTGSGLYVWCPAGSFARYNNINNNSGLYELQNAGPDNFDAQFNYWGTAMTEEMENEAVVPNPKNIARLYDAFDAPAYGSINYAGWLTAPVALPATPKTEIVYPRDGVVMNASQLRVSGIAVASDEVDFVDITSDNGTTWYRATGTNSWYYDWLNLPNGTYTFQARVTDKQGVFEISGDQITVTVDRSLPTTSGQLAGDETWSGEVIITGDVTVPSGVTLSISAGTIIKFSQLQDDRSSGVDIGRCELIVYGVLNAIGGSDPVDEIVFTSVAGNPRKSDWYGIRMITQTRNEIMDLTHCRIEYSRFGINVSASNFNPLLRLHDTTITKVSVDGIYASSENLSDIKLNISDSSITDCGRHGINAYMRNSGAIISGYVENTVISNTADMGVYLYQTNRGACDIAFSGNTIHSVVNYGIYIRSEYCYEVKSTAVFEDNIIYGVTTSNSSYGDGIYFGLIYNEAELIAVGNEIYNTAGHGLRVRTYGNDSWQSVPLFIAQNSIHNNSKYGISVEALQKNVVNAQIIANEVYANGSDGIRCEQPSNYTGTLLDMETIIALNDVYGNGAMGIVCTANTRVIIRNAMLIYNNVYANIGNGVQINGPLGSLANFNNFNGNGGAFELRNASSVNLDAQFNYWGAVITAEMDNEDVLPNPKNISGIFDSYDNAQLGTADYEPWLGEAVLVPVYPRSEITAPDDNSSLKTVVLRIKGVAVAPEGVDHVLVSIDGGTNWVTAQGTYSWYYDWQNPPDGVHTVIARAVDRTLTAEMPGSQITVTVDSTLPTTSGPLTSDENWSGVVEITGDVTVPAGVTLNIQPGTVIKFASVSDDQGSGNNSGLCEMIVAGTLNALGNSDPSENIVFTSSSASPVKGNWYGIVVVSGASHEAECNLANCVIEYSRIGVHVIAQSNNATLNMSNSSIRNLSIDGIFLDSAGYRRITADVSGTNISYADRHGIYACADGQNSIIDSVFEGVNISYTGNAGVYFYTKTRGAVTGALRNSSITNAVQYGIYMLVDYCYTSKSVFTVEGTSIGNVTSTVSTNGKGIYASTTYTDAEYNFIGNTVFDTANNGMEVRTYGNDSWQTVNVFIAGNNVYNTKGYGIYVQALQKNYVEAQILSNHVYNNTGEGIRCEQPSNYVGTPLVLKGIISLNTVHNNTSIGIFCRTKDRDALFFYNNVYDNGNGIQVIGQLGSSVNFNNLQNPGSTYELTNGSADNLDARFNYWRPAVTAEMDNEDVTPNPKNISAIVDDYDNVNLGIADYSKWLIAPVTVPEAPKTEITVPENDSLLKTAVLRIKGIAVAPDGTDYVQVSIDAGVTWHTATGSDSWYYDWANPPDGTHTIMAKVTDRNGVEELSASQVVVTIDSTLPTTSGPLSDDEHWSGVVSISGDVIVPQGVTLYIEQGTEIRFAPVSDDQGAGIDSGLCELIIEGTLVAVGGSDPTDKILFTSASASPAKANWYGIVVKPGLTAQAVAVLENCIIEYSRIGVYGYAYDNDLSVNVSDCTFRKFDLDGINLTSNHQHVITADVNGLSVDDAGRYGIYCYAEMANSSVVGVFDGVSVTNTGSSGINLYPKTNGKCLITIRNSSVSQAREYGIYAHPEYSYAYKSVFDFDNVNVYSVSSTTTSDGKGIYVWCRYTVTDFFLTDSEIYDTARTGVHLYTNGNDSWQALDVFIANNIVRNNGAHGIHVEALLKHYITVQILSNHVFSNLSDGIRCEQPSNYATSPIQLEAVLALNSVHNNGGWGIAVRAVGDDAGSILYNDVYSNAGNGIYVLAPRGSAANFNNIYSNGGTYALNNAGAENINAGFNYWGDTVTAAEMDNDDMPHPKNISVIYDNFDNSSYGIADYSNWRPVAVTIPAQLKSNVTYPADGAVFKTSVLRIQGIAVSPYGVDRVEVSPDSGIHWYEVSGRELWFYDWTIPGDGTYTLLSRVIDNASNIETPAQGVTITIDSHLPTTSGTLSDDEEWSGVVNVTGDITVPTGKKLTIEAGTTVVFDARKDNQSSGANTSACELIINGSLEVLGTPANPVLFTSSSHNPSSGDWYGIRFEPETDNDTAVIENAVIEYAWYGCYSYSTVNNRLVSLSIKNSDISYMGYDGIYMYAGGGADFIVEIDNTGIADCARYGIQTYITASGSTITGTISGVTVERCASYGMNFYSYSRGQSNLRIDGATISNVNAYGIYAETYVCYEVVSNYDIRNCNISNVQNSGAGIYHYVRYSSLVANIAGNTISNVAGAGIYIFGLSSALQFCKPVIVNNRVFSSGSHGIYIKAQTYMLLYPEILGNTVYWNAGNGIRCEDAGVSSGALNSLISFNTVEQNQSWGIYLQDTATATVTWNNLYLNSGELYNASSQTVDARYNFWGASTTAVMNTRDGLQNISVIYDKFDSSSAGTVYYKEWRNNAVDRTPDRKTFFLDPADGISMRISPLSIKGIAYASFGVESVQVSLDGTNWLPVSVDTRFYGKSLWSYETGELPEGSYTLYSRVLDNEGIMEDPANQITFTVDDSIITRKGTMTSDEIWSGTVILQGDVTIPAGITLTIAPGTTVLFAELADATFGGLDSSRTELIVNGSLICEGTQSEPIVLTSENLTSAQKNHWYGIHGSGTIRLRFTTVEYAVYGIQAYLDDAGDEVSVRDCVIQHNGNYGIYIRDTKTVAISNINIQDSIIDDNTGYGIYLLINTASTYMTASITGNTISNNTTGGIYCQSDRASSKFTVSIIGNTIHTNASYGINIGNRYNAASTYVLEGNTIHHSGIAFYGYYYASSMSSSIVSLSVSGNTIHSGTDGIKIYLRYYNLQPTVANNTVYNNSGSGLHFNCEAGTLLPYIEANNIYSNQGSGIYLKPSSVVTVTGNSVLDNANYDVYNDAGYAVNAQGNWWGVSTTNEMNVGFDPLNPQMKNISRIYDKFDNASKGQVDYLNWIELYVPPTAPVITSSVESPTSDTFISLSGTKDANTSVVINGIVYTGDFASTAWSVSTVVLQEGSNNITVYCKNTFGMVSPTVTLGVVRDTEPPYIYTSIPAHNSAIKSIVDKIDITLIEAVTELDNDATLAGATVEDGAGQPVAGVWSTYYNHFIFTPSAGLDEGVYTITIYPTDTPLGNTAVATVSFTVDRTPPLPPVVSPVVSPTKVSPCPLVGTFKEANTAVLLNGVQIVDYTPATTWSYSKALTQGSNVLNLISRDRAGNMSSNVPVTVVYDSVAPVLVSTEPPSNAYVQQCPLRVAFVFTDATTSLDPTTTIASASIKNSQNNTIAGTWFIENTNTVVFMPSSAFAQNTYTASVTAYDLVQNSVSASITFTYDLTPPAVPTLREPIVSPSPFVKQTIKGYKESYSSIWINGAEVIGFTSSTTWDKEVWLQEGENVYVIFSRDRAGNQSGNLTVIIQYDETAPLPVTQLTANGNDIGTVVKLNWSGYNEAVQGDVLQYLIYASDQLFTQVGSMSPINIVPAGTFSYTVTNLLKSKLYYFAVVAEDTKGNALTSVTPVSAIPLDTVAPPNVTAIAVVCGDNDLTYTWTPAADPYGDLEGYKVNFDGATYLLGPAETIFQRTGLSPATSYSFVIRSYDGDNNESSGVQKTGVTLLNNPLNIETSPANGYINLSWSASQPSNLVKYYRVYYSTTDFTSVEGMSYYKQTTATSTKVSGLTNEVRYYFAVTAVNLSDGMKTSVVTVYDEPEPDLQGPELSNVKWMGTPLTSGAVLTRPGSFTLTATDPVNVSRVEFTVDDGSDIALFHIDSNGSTSYSCFWNIATVNDGAYTLAIRAFDTLGNVTQISYPVTVDLTVPNPPVIVQPVAGYVTNSYSITVSGTSDISSEVIILDDESAILAGPVGVSSAGVYSISVPVEEGENRIHALARNRKGTNLIPSNEITVTRDTTLPEPPTNISATSKEDGKVYLAWQSSIAIDTGGYNVYRAAFPFTDISQAIKVNSVLRLANNYTDLPEADGAWYYRIETVDLAGNISTLSAQVQGISDRTKPTAVVTYTPYGKYDPYTGRMATDNVSILLTVSEPLRAVPFLSITPAGGVPVTVDLTQVDSYTYTGSFLITAQTPSGTAQAVFSGRDMANNRGTTITSGGTCAIDSRGPSVVYLSILPAEPIKNDKNDPVSCVVIIGLDEAVKPDTMPALWYTLSVTSPSTLIPITGLLQIGAQPGEAQRWQGSFVLHEDAGYSIDELMEFVYQAGDDLDNVSQVIGSKKSFQVYQGDLPKPARPVGLTVTAASDCHVLLWWYAVDNAVGYEIVRSPGESGPADYIRVGQVTEYIDQTSEEGYYTYTISSIRQANNQESVSLPSDPVQVNSDSTPPNPPQNLTLTLIGAGLRLEWDEPVFTETVTYSIYRAVSQQGLVSASNLLASNIAQTMVIDPLPSAQHRWYAVTAVDAAGNESASATNYTNMELLPLSSIKAVQVDNLVPVLSWTHPHHGGSIDYYDIFLGKDSLPIKLNPVPVYGLSYLDAGYAGDERRYTVRAVDDNGDSSVGRSIVLPNARVTLSPDSSVYRGIMNRMNFLVENLGQTDLVSAHLSIQLEGHEHISQTFSVPAGAQSVIPVVVGGFADLPNVTSITQKLISTPNVGESIEVVRHYDINVKDSMLVLTIQNQEFLRGGSGTVQFSLKNTCDEEIEIITAKQHGSKPSDQIRLFLRDKDGNILSSATFKQTIGAMLATLSNGDTVARIPSSAIFISEPFDIYIPSSAPDNTILELVIDKIHYKVNQPQHVSINGMKTTRNVMLVETIYYGDIVSIEKDSGGTSDVYVITGKAVNRETGLFMPGVPLKLIISVEGYERSFTVYTGQNGQFEYSFKPNPLESGVYKVSVIHPDLMYRPQQGEFVIRKVSPQYSGFNLNVVRNYEYTQSVVVSTGNGTSVTNLRLEYNQADQPGALFAQGVTVELSDPVDVGSKSKGTLNFTVWGNNEAAEMVAINLKITSDEAGADGWAMLPVNIRFSDAKPVLSYTPNYIDTGVALGGSVTEKLTLKNKGLSSMNNVHFALVSDHSGTPAPNWIYYVTNFKQGGFIDVGGEPELMITFNPPNNTGLIGNQTYYLRVTSSNYPTVHINLHVAITEHGMGMIEFKVVDIYTGTYDTGNNLIEGVAQARVYIQNDQFPDIQYTRYTDSAGELSFGKLNPSDPAEELPPGSYRYRVTATDHIAANGRFWIKPGVSVHQTIQLEYNVITVEWQVVPTTIEDKYEIILSATYKTFVPAPVIVVEPASITLPVMRAGDVFNTEFDLVNYGLIRADDIKYYVPSNNPCYKYEMLEDLPNSIGAMDRFTVPYRVTRLCPLGGGGGGGGWPDDDGYGDDDNDGEPDNGSGSGELDNDSRKSTNCDDCIREMNEFLLTMRYVCDNGQEYSKQVYHVSVTDNGNCNGCGGGLIWPDVSQQGSGGHGVGGPSNNTYKKPEPSKRTVDKACLPDPSRTEREYIDGYVLIGREENCNFNQRVGFTLDGRMIAGGIAHLGSIPRAHYLDPVYPAVGMMDYMSETHDPHKTQMHGGRWSNPYYGNYAYYEPEGRYYEVVGEGVYFRGDTANITGCINGDCRPQDGHKSVNDVGSSVDPIMRQYNDDIIDMDVAVPGNKIYLRRLYYDGKWHWQHLRNNLNFNLNLSQTRIETIEKAGAVFKRSADDLYTHGTSVLKKLDTNGYRWNDKYGFFCEYDNNGRMLNYGSRTGVIGKCIYQPGAEGKLIGVTDVNDRQVLWFVYTGDQLTQVYDLNGRAVSYGYTGGNLTSVTDAIGNITQYTYTNDRITRKIDPVGNKTLISYDLYGNVTEITDNDGRIYRFEYDVDSVKREFYARITYPSGIVEENYYDRYGDLSRHLINGKLITKITKNGRNYVIKDEKGNETRTYYDEWDNLIKVEFPNGAVLSYEYEYTFNRPVKKIDQRGVVTEYTYDSMGNLVRLVEASETATERVFTFTYNSYGQLICAIGEPDIATDSTVITHTRDSSGSTTRLTDPMGHYLEYLDSDDQGNVLSLKGTRGEFWAWEYDNEDNLLSETVPGSVTSVVYAYTDNGRLQSLINAANSQFFFGYDSKGNVTSVTGPDGSSISIAYNDKRNVTKLIDELGRETRFIYDTEGRLASYIDSHGYATTYAYAEDSQDVAISSKPKDIIYPTGSIARFEYDRNQLKTKMTEIVDDDTQYVYNYLYDLAGNLVRSTDESNNATYFAYDELNRLTSVTDTLGNKVSYTFDDRNNLLSVTDENNAAVTCEYDLNNRLVSRKMPMGQEYFYEYDNSGNLVSVIDAENRKTTYYYDALNRLDKVDYHEASDYLTPVKTVLFTHNNMGQLTSYDDGSTSALFAYDNYQRKISETVDYGSFSLSFSYEYYKNGLKKSFTGPDGVKLSYVYDSNNQLIAIDIPGKGQINYNSYYWTKPAKMTFPGGSTREYTYNALLMPESIVVKDTGENSIMERTYTYGSGKLIDAVQTEYGTHVYHYDDLARLTDEINPVFGAQNYTYDPAGNRLTSADIFGNWSYNDNNELISFGSVTYEYDNNGNIVTVTNGSDVRYYIYDIQNRLVRIEDNIGGVIALYYYDPFGRRLWKEAGGIRTYFFYSDEGLIGEYDATGSEIKTYGYAPYGMFMREPLYQKVGSRYLWYHTDHQGSAQVITNLNGRVIWTAKYGAFGKAMVETYEVENDTFTVENNILFGCYYDAESGLYYSPQGYYDPSTGRYTDPCGYSHNRYLLARNNPVNARAPVWRNVLKTKGLSLPDTARLGVAKTTLKNSLYNSGYLDSEVYKSLLERYKIPLINTKHVLIQILSQEDYNE